MQYGKPLMLTACLFFSALLCGQQYPFVHYTPKDGLVNSRVRKAFQDSKGRMYFMTYGGLSMYDGTRFRNYTVQNGLSSDVVNDMLEMGDDSIWIACNTNKLNYIRQGKIRTFITADGFYPLINKFLKSKEGLVYVITDDGLFVFRENRFIPLPFRDSRGRDAGKFLLDIIEWGPFLFILPDLALNSLAPVSLYIYDKNKQEIIATHDKNKIYSITKSSDNEIYMSVGKEIVQLDTAALPEGRIQFLPPHPSYKNLQPDIHYINFDRQKNFWSYSSLKKITKIDSNGIRKEFSINNGLSSNDFSGIFLDREGTVWITMHGAGVNKLVNDNIELYDRFRGLKVKNIYTDTSTDSVYLFTETGKIALLYQENLKEIAYTGTKINSTAFNVHSGKMYMSNGKDILSFQQNGRNILLYRDTLEQGFGNIFFDPFDNMVLAGNSFITVLIDDTINFRYPVKSYIDQIAFDKSNRLWVASRGGELYVLRINPGKPDMYLELLKTYDQPLPGLTARSVTVDHFNNVWVGTRYTGLYCFHFNEDLTIKSFKQYTVKEGLSDNFVTHLTRDNDNNIWASTAAGVDKLRYDNGKVHIENITRSSHIYEHILKTHTTRSGIAWSQTADGNLIRISKKNDPYTISPSLLITEMRIGNTTIDSIIQPASFSYKQNSFAISAAAPSFYNEKQVQYSYWLQGSGNDQWSEPSNNSTFNFINLNPRKYNLKIKAVFPAGRYPDQEIDYAFVIHPPWWQTWWFRTGIGILGIGILVAGIRYYYRRKLEKQKLILEKQQAIEKERTRIATDIHDDLGSGLSRIRYLGEMIKLKSSQQQNILPDIEKISVFSDEMVDKMNEIVWALNKKNDTLEALIYYTRSFAVDYLSNNQLECKVKVPEKIPVYIINGEMRRNIFLSVKESLHNIIKHAGATAAVLTIELNHHLVIDIHDNGKGINWEKARPFSNGIANIRKRMEDLKGTVNFSNENGTRVVFSIPFI